MRELLKFWLSNRPLSSNPWFRFLRQPRRKGGGVQSLPPKSRLGNFNHEDSQPTG